MLLLSRSLYLWKRVHFKCPIIMETTHRLLSWYKKSSFSEQFRKNYNSKPFHEWMQYYSRFFFFHLHVAGKLVFIRLQGRFPIPWTRSYLTFTHSSALLEGRWHMGLIRSPPVLAVFGVAHSLPLAGFQL